MFGKQIFIFRAYKCTTKLLFMFYFVISLVILFSNKALYNFILASKGLFCKKFIPMIATFISF